MVRYEGVEERRKDWMTVLTRFDTETTERSPLSNLLETIIQADGAVLFQVVFEPRADWSPKAQRQKGRLKRGVHTMAGMVIRSALDGVLGVSDEEKRERHRGDTPEEVGGTIMDSQVDGQRAGQSRMAQIDLKNPSHTYNVSLRAAAQSQRIAENLQDSLNQMSGQFYSVDGKYLGKNKNEYKRMLHHGITYSNGWEMMTRRKPLLVCNIEELANVTRFHRSPKSLIHSQTRASASSTVVSSSRSVKTAGLPRTQQSLNSTSKTPKPSFSRTTTVGTRSQLSRLSKTTTGEMSTPTAPARPTQSRREASSRTTTSCPTKPSATRQSGTTTSAATTSKAASDLISNRGRSRNHRLIHRGTRRRHQRRHRRRHCSARPVTATRTSRVGTAHR